MHRDNPEINKQELIDAIKRHLQKIANATKILIKKHDEKTAILKLALEVLLDNKSVYYLYVFMNTHKEWVKAVGKSDTAKLIEDVFTYSYQTNKLLAMMDFASNKAIIYSINGRDLTIDQLVNEYPEFLNADAVNQFNRGGFTPLHFAVYNNHKHLVVKLLECGADVNLKSLCPPHLSPLELAKNQTNRDILHLLRTHDTDKTIRDLTVLAAPREVSLSIDVLSIIAKYLSEKDKLSYSMVSSKFKRATRRSTYLFLNEKYNRQIHNKKYIFSSILAANLHYKQFGDQWCLLQYYCGVLAAMIALGSTDGVEQYLNSGGDPNILSSDWGHAPLHIAIYQKRLDVINLLIRHHADVNAKTMAWITPLHLAAILGDTEIAQALLDAGALVNANDEFGRTALYFAKSFERDNMQRMLELNHGVKYIPTVDYRSRAGWGILATHAKSGNVEAVKDWLSHLDDPQITLTGREISAHGSKGIALYYAMEGKDDQSCLTLAELLIAAGADVNYYHLFTDETPLMCAVYHRKYELIELLMKHGADPCITNKEGKSAISLADDERIIELLLTNTLRPNV